MSTTEKNIFSEFQPASKEQWQARVQKESGKDFSYENLIVEKDGLKTEPYLTKEEMKAVRTVPENNSDWQIRQNFFAADFKNTNEKIIKALENGVNALGIFIKDNISATDFNVLLKDVYLDMISIHIVAENNLASAVAAFKDYIETQNQAAQNLKGSFSFQHIENRNIAELKSLLEKYQAYFPHFKFITVVSDNTGIVEELTYAFKTTNQYLQQLSGAGIDKHIVTATIQFKVFVGVEYFFEIAKLRAYRLLWQQLLSLHHLKNISAFIQAEKSWRHNDENDACKNILRHTTEAMSAAIGGCDVLCLQSTDTTEQLNNDFFNRIAVNIQHLLKHESHLDKVTDIAAGSYYIETITQQIVEKVWANMQQA